MAKPDGSVRPDGDKTTRELIHDVAVHLFTRNGFHVTSMKQLANALGMTPANLYNYYASKEEILFDVLSQEMDETIARHAEIVDANPDPVKRLWRLAYDLILSDLEDPVAAFVSLHGLDGLLPMRRRAIADKMRAVRQNFLQGIEEGQEAGHFARVDPSLAAITVLTTCSFVSSWYDPRGARSPYEVAAFTASSCLSSLGYVDAWHENRLASK